GPVPVGAGLTEAGDGAVDDAGVLLAQPLVADAQAIGRARPKVLDGHVGGAGEAVDDLSPLRRAHVDGDALLVAVDAEEVAAFAPDEGWSPVPCIIAGAGALHLDDLRAEVGEHHGAVGSAEDA